MDHDFRRASCRNFPISGECRIGIQLQDVLECDLTDKLATAEKISWAKPRGYNILPSLERVIILQTQVRDITLLDFKLSGVLAVSEAKRPRFGRKLALFMMNLWLCGKDG